MGFFDSLFGNEKSNNEPSVGIIPYGNNKTDGSHDHRTNRGEDRTPNQKRADKNKTKK